MKTFLSASIEQIILYLDISNRIKIHDQREANFCCDKDAKWNENSVKQENYS